MMTAHDGSNFLGFSRVLGLIVVVWAWSLLGFTIRGFVHTSSRAVSTYPLPFSRFFPQLVVILEEDRTVSVLSQTLFHSVGIEQHSETNMTRKRNY